MPFSFPSNDGMISLPDNVVMDACALIRSDLCAHLASGQPLRLDADGVREIDYAVYSFLCRRESLLCVQVWNSPFVPLNKTTS